MANKPKKEPTKKRDRIVCILGLTAGTLCMIEGIISLLSGSTSSIIIVCGVISYVYAFKPSMRLIDNNYKTDNTETKTDTDKGQKDG